MSSTPKLNHLSQCCQLEIGPPSPGPTVFVAAPNLLWEPPSEEPALTRDEIHVWRAWLGHATPWLDQLNLLLSDDEQARARRFHFEKDRALFIARRGLLRMILAHYLRFDAALLRFSCGPHGKPALSFPGYAQLCFNLSHSDALALYAVTCQVPVGVDVERVRVIAEAARIAEQHFSSREAADWDSLCCSERPKAFLQHWVRREAAVKATGRGLTDALVRAEASQPAEGLERGTILLNGRRKWVAWDLDPAVGYIGALVCQWPADGDSSSIRPTAARRLVFANAGFASRPSRWSLASGERVQPSHVRTYCGMAGDSGPARPTRENEEY